LDTGFRLTSIGSRHALLTEAKLLLLAKLFELGRVSSGKAAEICNMTRVEFLLSMGKLGVSLAQLDSDELKREIADA
jgi:predicted HTH domain antitoxin